MAAVLTIIQAWRKAGSSRAAVDNLVTYGGAWSDSVPPDVVGHPDPATALLEQVRHLRIEMPTNTIFDQMKIVSEGRMILPMSKGYKSLL